MMKVAGWNFQESCFPYLGLNCLQLVNLRNYRQLENKVLLIINYLQGVLFKLPVAAFHSSVVTTSMV